MASLRVPVKRWRIRDFMTDPRAKRRRVNSSSSGQDCHSPVSKKVKKSVAGRLKAKGRSRLQAFERAKASTVSGLAANAEMPVETTKSLRETTMPLVKSTMGAKSATKNTEQIPVSPVRPFKIRRKDERALIKRSNNRELVTSSGTLVEGIVRLDEGSRLNSPTLVGDDINSHREEISSVSREPSSWRYKRDSRSRSASREGVRQSRSPNDYSGSSRRRPSEIKDAMAVGSDGHEAPGRLSADSSELASPVAEHSTLEPEVGENQVFLALYAEAIDLIRQFNNLSGSTETPASMLPPGIDMVFGLKKDTKVSYELPCSSHAESVLQHVNAWIAGRDNSLRTNRSFKFIPPPMMKQEILYDTNGSFAI
ncbi:uncharacterized protein LOC135225581 isoform X1 [Macrobrachium nipponense]|uniref:uncharacterized protein LOC135225581 isoform X1 n=1 Tax=Macrobrachium nipponense TaxID=159736 RepID=UPI0030C87256